MRVSGIAEPIVIGGEDVKAYVPHPLPPQKPPLMRLDKEISRWLREAEEGLGRLNLIHEMSPSANWLSYGFMRKEAVSSATFGGKKASLVDLLQHEGSGGNADVSGVNEASNYLDALTFAHSELSRTDAPQLSMRLIARIHLRVLRGSEAAGKTPAGMRNAQAWIGGTRPGNAIFVPPPRRALPQLISDFEGYLQVPDELPALMRIGLLHAQLVTIHPFMHGNGRIARLLISLLLKECQLLEAPLMYVSLFFKRHRDEYYRRLAAMRNDGDWEGWMRFFLEAVAIIAEESWQKAKDILALIHRDRAAVLAGGTSTVTGARLFELLPEHPLISTAQAMDLLSTTRPTAMKAMNALVDAGVLVETTGKKRDRIFSYRAYLALLNRGMD